MFLISTTRVILSVCKPNKIVYAVTARDLYSLPVSCMQQQCSIPGVLARYIWYRTSYASCAPCCAHGTYQLKDTTLLGDAL